MTRLRWTWLSGALRSRLADGAREIVWVDQGDEILVHASTLTLDAVENTLVARLDLEADEVGRERLVVSFALGLDRRGKLVAAAQTLPQSNGTLAARWGDSVAIAILAALGDLLEKSRRQGWRWLLLFALGRVIRRAGRQ